MLFTFTVDQILWPLTLDILMPFSIKLLVDTCPISGATDTPFLDFWWCLLLFSKEEWAALFTLGGDVHVCSPRFAFGATPADPIAAGMAAELSSSTYLQTSIGGAQD